MNIFKNNYFNTLLIETIKTLNSEGKCTLKNLVHCIHNICVNSKQLSRDIKIPSTASLSTTLGNFLYDKGYRFITSKSSSFCIDQIEFMLFSKSLTSYAPQNLYISFSIDHPIKYEFISGKYYCHIALLSSDSLIDVQDYLVTMYSDKFSTMTISSDHLTITLNLIDKLDYVPLLQDLSKEYLLVWKHQGFFQFPFPIDAFPLSSRTVPFHEESEFSDLISSSSKKEINLKLQYKNFLTYYLNQKYIPPSIDLDFLLPSPPVFPYIFIDCIPVKLLSTTEEDVLYRDDYCIYLFFQVQNTPNNVFNIELSHLEICLASTTYQDEPHYFFNFLKEKNSFSKYTILQTDNLPLYGDISSHPSSVTLLTTILREPFYTLLLNALDFTNLKRYKVPLTYSKEEHSEELHPCFKHSFNSFKKDLNTVYLSSPDKFNIFINKWTAILNSIFTQLKLYDFNFSHQIALDIVPFVQEVNLLLECYRSILLAQTTADNSQFIKFGNSHLVETNFSRTQDPSNHSFLSFLPEPSKLSQLSPTTLRLLCSPPLFTYRTLVNKIIKENSHLSQYDLETLLFSELVIPPHKRDHEVFDCSL